MSEKRTILFIPLKDEMALDLTLDQPSSDYGMAVQVENKSFYCIFWTRAGEKIIYLDPILLDDSSPFNFILHPRASHEISSILGLSGTPPPDVRLVQLLRKAMEDR